MKTNAYISINSVRISWHISSVIASRVSGSIGNPTCFNFEIDMIKRCLNLKSARKKVHT